jgi:hypothetical protein
LVLEIALNAIADAIEKTNLRWGSSLLDGSSDEKRVTIQPTDPNMDRFENLRIGIHWMFPPRTATRAPMYGDRVVRMVNPLSGEVMVEKGLQFKTRAIQIHVFVKETRTADKRVGFTVATELMRNEGRLLAMMGDSKQWQVPDADGTLRGFLTQYTPINFPSTVKLELHGVYQFDLTYPVLDPNGQEPARIARVNLITGEPANQPRDLSDIAAPVTVATLPDPLPSTRVYRGQS